MAMTLSTDAGISQRTNVYAEMKMLEHAAPVVVLDRFGDSKQMPKNKGVNIKFRRPRVFTAVTQPLVEGVTPAATQFTFEDVSARLYQYGQVVEITDVIEDTHEDPVLNEAAKQAGENIGRTIEALTYGVLKAGTNVFYANGSARTDVNTPVTVNKLRAVARFLKAQKAMKITEVMDGGPKWGMVPVEASFIAVCHTDLEADLRGLANFKVVADYANRRTVHEQEFGTLEDFRFVSSPDLAPWLAGGAASTSVVNTGGTADVYPILCFGKHAYGTVPLRGQGAVSPAIFRPTPTKEDPLGQRGVVGWKTWFCALILNQAWMCRLEVAATSL